MLTQASLFGWLFFQESVVLLFELMLVLIQSKNYFHFSVDRGNKHLCSFLWLFHTSVRYVLNSASLFVRTFAFLEIDENIKQKIGKRHFSIRFKNKTFTQNLLKSLENFLSDFQKIRNIHHTYCSTSASVYFCPCCWLVTEMVTVY